MQSEFLIIIFVLAVSSLLNLVYLGEIVLRGFFKSGAHSEGNGRSALGVCRAVGCYRSNVVGTVFRRRQFCS